MDQKATKIARLLTDARIENRKLDEFDTRLARFRADIKTSKRDAAFTERFSCAS